MLATSGGTQEVQDVDPTLDTAPAGQIVHSVTDVAPEVARKLPAGQPEHAYALPSRNEPAGQKNDDGVGVTDGVDVEDKVPDGVIVAVGVTEGVADEDGV